MDHSYTLLVTGDGSHTVKWEQGNVTYHSNHGAIQESQHVFIKHGLDYALQSGKRKLSIFEMGLGTGLNALLTWNAVSAKDVNIDYHTIEQFALPESILSELNYTELLGLSPHLMDSIHRCKDGRRTTLKPTFEFTKHIGDIHRFEHHASYDLVYFDAFGPGCQPTLWEERILIPLYQSMHDGSVLVTFCAQGAFKRMLRKIGFQVEALPGPPGKREMTRAIK